MGAPGETNLAVVHRKAISVRLSLLMETLAEVAVAVSGVDRGVMIVDVVVGEDEEASPKVLLARVEVACHPLHRRRQQLLEVLEDKIIALVFNGAYLANLCMAVWHRYGIGMGLVLILPALLSSCFTQVHSLLASLYPVFEVYRTKWRNRFTDTQSWLTSFVLIKI